MRTLLVFALLITGIVMILATLGGVIVGVILLVKTLSKRDSGT